MPTPTWDPKLETGHAEIDADHREIIARLHAIKDAIDQGAGREKVVEMAKVLQKYAQGHFAREEGLMYRLKCSAFHANCAAHRAFSLKIEGWLDRIAAGETSLAGIADINREVIGWLTTHIATLDCQLRLCQPETIRKI